MLSKFPPLKYEENEGENVGVETEDTDLFLGKQL